MSDDMRKDFEAWYLRESGHTAGPLWNGQYASGRVEDMWQGYQAGRVSKAGWIAFNDRAPESEVDVLVTDGKSVAAASWFLSPGGDWYAACVGGYDGEICFDVAHWMPLPAAPDQEGK